jgi:hypothetical protein
MARPVEQLYKKRNWLSLRQFAMYVAGVTYVTACRMRDRGDIVTIKIGGVYTVPKEEVERFLREGNRKGGRSSLPPDQDQIINEPDDTEREEFQ